MRNPLAGIGLRGKRAAEHDDDEDAKANEFEDDKDAKAEDDEEDEDPKAKAAEGDEDEDEDEDEKEAKAAASLRRATKAAAAKATARASAIFDLCNLAKRPKLAGEYIASGASPATVGKHLLTLRADESGTGEIASQTGPNGSPGGAAAMWDKAIEKNAKRLGLDK